MKSGQRSINPVDTGLHLQHEALLGAIIDSAMDAVVALDDEQRVVLFNPTAEAMFGKKSADAIGRPIDQFLPERFRANHHGFVAAFGATGDTSRAMGHLRPLAALRADGTEFPIEATISRVTMDGRRYVAAIIRDISERQEAEESVRRQARLLDLAYDAIFTWDWGGSITSWNLGAERLYGFTREEAVGRAPHELLKTHYPEKLSVVWETLEQNGVWEGELTHVNRDGRSLVVESRFVLSQDDRHPFVLEVCRDVTARKQAESERAAVVEREAAARAEAAAVEGQRDRLREIFDGLPSGVIILTPDTGQVEFANSAFAQLVFVEAASAGILPVYGRDFTFLRADGTPLPAEDRPGALALRGERVRNQQLLMDRTGGERLPVVAHSAPLRERPDAPMQAIVVIQDVTQLRQAEQLKDDFLALISHEFRTPLTAIHGGAHLLSRDGDALTPETRREVLDDIEAESERLDRMLGNILSLANVLAGRLRASTEPVLLAPMARKVAAAVGARSPAHTFVVDFPTDVPPVEADPDLLEQVLRNLYENAVKYAPHGGEVRTTANSNHEMVAIQIDDQGIGIAPESVGMVFERFRRVGSDPTIRGMGLGLYLSRHLVEAQGGQIAVGSLGIGRGASFTVTLPIARGWTDEAATEEMQR